MKILAKKYLLLSSFLESLLTVTYCLGVGLLMTYLGAHFSQPNQIVASLLLLLLFIVSALITATLVLGYPIYFFLQKDLKTAIQNLILNVVWLTIFIIFIILILL
ncbi:hypothetical protein COY34_02405 [candidate division WWE3 bacterium CG_4_10_14_0_2_um_filter_42_8]|uniref:Uncharacterized protein n=1 Tax=candidate division WWE3 bacterium CG_4_10_14_0_2_um_filter_42_8 TaxID=1975074 RepID=A0A2M7TBX7_UNCKA|nr:MAG: hypothetical protein COY34_02405 [candidate division WWE3 bacterium CG_4_10_14_0_2_um_filter_42_8]